MRFKIIQQAPITPVLRKQTHEENRNVLRSDGTKTESGHHEQSSPKQNNLNVAIRLPSYPYILLDINH